MESDGSNGEDVEQVDPGQLAAWPEITDYDLATPGTYSDGMALTRLVASGRGLTGIDILAEYQFLRHVDLSDNKLTDITPLQKMAPQLETLLLANNALTDDSFAGIQDFPALKRLDVSGNRKVTTAAPLMSSSLVWLSLRHTSVSDAFTALQNSLSLEFLDISGTPSTVLPVGLPRLTTLIAQECRLAYPFGWAAGHDTRLAAKRLFYDEFKQRELSRIAREREEKEKEKAEKVERKRLEREEIRRLAIEKWEAEQAALVAKGKRRHRHRPPTPYPESEPEEESEPEVFESQPLDDDDDEILSPGRLPSLICLDLCGARLLTLAGLPRVCPVLESLDASGSRLGELTGFGDLAVPPTLERLCFTKTPLMDVADCRGRVLRLCPRMKVLNGEEVTDEERCAAERFKSEGSLTYPEPPRALETPMDEARKECDAIFDLADPEPSDDLEME